MNASGMNQRGSQVFEKVLGKLGQASNTYEVSESRPPRLSFERSDGSSLSVAYGRVTLVRHYKRDIYISLGKHFIHIEGDRLRPLYDVLHQEQVVHITELAASPEDDFAEETTGQAESEMAVVRKITWTSELEMQG